MSNRPPSQAEIQQLRLEAKRGNKLAQHALSVIDQIGQGGVPLGGPQAAPPGFKLMNMGDVKIHPLPCGACGSTLFEKLQFAEAFYDENDPTHSWCGKPTPITLCAKCGSEQVITTIRKQTDDKKEPEVRYEYSTRIFKYGMQQIQHILAEQRVQIVTQIADILDEHFGKEREAEATELMLKIGKEFGLKPADGTAAVPPAPAPEPEPVASPKSSIITEV